MCEHEFGLKKRDTGSFYCPVCRVVLDEEIDEDIGSRSSESGRYDGERRKGSEGRVGVLRKL